MSGAWVYILTNKPNGTLYISVTNDVRMRVEQHRMGNGSSFTRRYNLHRLVFAEWHEDIARAIQRETSLKRWPRAWKMALIEEANPEWIDLVASLA